MEEEGSFEKIGASAERMYGPRGLVVCGLSVDEQKAVYSLVRNGSLPDLPVIFVTDDMLDVTMAGVLENPDAHGQGEPSSTRRAMIMSGFTEMELHWMMSAYRRLGLPRPLWATLTPTSESWPVRQLIAELAAEDDAVGH